MELFNVLMGGAEHRVLRFFDDGEINFLIAASMLTFEKRWKKHYIKIELSDPLYDVVQFVREAIPSRYHILIWQAYNIK